MKRFIIRASKDAKARRGIFASVQYDGDPEFKEYFVEAQALAAVLARKVHLTAKITEYGEDYYGYPCATIGIFKGPKLIESAQISCWDGNGGTDVEYHDGKTGDEYHHISEDPNLKEYLENWILPIQVIK